jgi:hypothetical protein
MQVFLMYFLKEFFEDTGSQNLFNIIYTYLNVQIQSFTGRLVRFYSACSLNQQSVGRHVGHDSTDALPYPKRPI